MSLTTDSLQPVLTQDLHPGSALFVIKLQLTH